MCKMNKKNVKFAITGLEGPLGMEEVKAHRIFNRSAQEGCEVVSL